MRMTGSRPGKQFAASSGPETTCSGPSHTARTASGDTDREERRQALGVAPLPGLGRDLRPDPGGVAERDGQGEGHRRLLAIVDHRIAPEIAQEAASAQVDAVFGKLVVDLVEGQAAGGVGIVAAAQHQDR